MHLADLQSKEDSCWSESSNSLPLPNSFSEMPFEDPSSVRSGFLIHQEEQLNQVISMAGTDPRPSDVPCLVETSTAHDGFLFLVSSSCTGDLKLLGSLSKALSPDSNPQSSFLPSPEMFEPLNQTSAQPGRRTNFPLSSTAKLGFLLLGPFLLGPLRFLSPLTKDVAFDLPLLSSRFERNSYLSYSSQYVCRLMEPFVRRLHLEYNPPLLLDWLEIDIGNLFLDRIIDSALKVRSLNELGIMIQTIWRCDYRCIFRPSSSSPCMLIETPKTQYINLLKYPTKNLKFSGIMTPSPWSGSYHRSYQSSTSKHNISRTITTTRVTTHRIPAKAMLQLLPLSPESYLALIHLSTSLSHMTVTTLSALGSVDVDQSCNHDLTCLSLLLSGCLTALLDYCLMFFYLLVYDFGESLPL